VLHELAHSLIARRFDIEMKGITLFVFGGVAEMTDEPKSPEAELFVAIAGPIMSLALGGIAFALYQLGTAQAWPDPILGVAWYLVFINVAVVCFNLVPAFPLDGGRVLRSLIWRFGHDVRKATRITAGIGRGFGFVLIALGVLSLFSGQLIAGIWWFLIGMFLRGAANMSYQQLITRRALEGEPVSRFMTTDPITVPNEISLESLVDDFVYRYHHKFYPVADDGQLVGCIGVDDVKTVPREEWAGTPVRSAMRECTDENTIEPTADAMHALTAMNRGRRSRLLVVDNGQLVGIITLKDLLDFLSLRVELEES
jgi:Zn-dependent protease/predicted transcriptional regulator